MKTKKVTFTKEQINYVKKGLTETKDHSTLYVLGLFALIGITVLILNHFELINDSFFTM